MKFLWITIPNMIVCYGLGKTDELFGTNSLYFLYIMIVIAIVSTYIENKRTRKKT